MAKRTDEAMDEQMDKVQEASATLAWGLVESDRDKIADGVCELMFILLDHTDR